MKALACGIVFIAALLFATRASAQQETVSSAPLTADPGLRIPAALWAGAVTADQITTFQFSSRYSGLLRERNPLIRGLDGHPSWLVAAGTTLDAAAGWAAYRLLGRSHPRLLKIALYGAAGYRTYLAIYNIQMMRQARDLRLGPR
jgi:hypothetical protein